MWWGTDVTLALRRGSQWGPSLSHTEFTVCMACNRLPWSTVIRKVLRRAVWTDQPWSKRARGEESVQGDRLRDFKPASLVYTVSSRKPGLSGEAPPQNNNKPEQEETTWLQSNFLLLLEKWRGGRV